MRRQGILMPISSLPSKYGIGTFGKESYEFVDFLKKAGQKLWQILPLGPTGYGASPYQSFSTFAGNPYFIDLETLIQDGLLTKKECDEVDFGDHPNYVDYGKLYNGRFPLLRKAWERAVKKGLETNKEYVAFLKENAFWLDDYCMFMAPGQGNSHVVTIGTGGSGDGQAAGFLRRVISAVVPQNRVNGEVALQQFSAGAAAGAAACGVRRKNFFPGC